MAGQGPGGLRQHSFAAGRSAYRKTAVSALRRGSAAFGVNTERNPEQNHDKSFLSSGSSASAQPHW